jgi:CDGSH-type Zn-finger protein
MCNRGSYDPTPFCRATPASPRFAAAHTHLWDLERFARWWRGIGCGTMKVRRRDMAEIIERENGPLVVKGVESFRHVRGAEIQAKPVMALCRCGHSANKPFCDGSHKKAEFQSSGGEPEGLDRLFKYKGQEVTVYYNPMVCSHAAECLRIARNVFDTDKRPWVRPDEGTLDQVTAVITACPSGALTLSPPSGTPEHRVSSDRAQIEVQRHGPYWVTGVDPPAKPNGAAMTGEKYALCRCGLSGNKPFCDGSHRDTKWRDGSKRPDQG